MRVFREPEEPDYGKEALTFALGAMGGLALGLVLSRRQAPAPSGGSGPTCGTARGRWASARAASPTGCGRRASAAWRGSRPT